VGSIDGILVGEMVGVLVGSRVWEKHTLHVTGHNKCISSLIVVFCE
jgi:hypothetical protein